MLLPIFVRSLALLLLVGACGATDRVTPSGDGDERPEDQVDAGPPGPDAAPRLTRMYAHTGDTLYTVDDQDFELVEVGPFNLPGGEEMNDLAVTPGGEVYGLTANKLYQIGGSTGEASFMSAVGGISNVGLTFLPDGSLLAADAAGGVRQLHPQSGSIDELGEYGGGYATAGDLVAVADGTMFAIADEGPNGDENENNVLLRIDPATGQFEQAIGGIGFGGVWGAAYANGNVYAFTRDGDIIEIDPGTAGGSLVKSYPGISFFGAGVTPLVDVE